MHRPGGGTWKDRSRLECLIPTGPDFGPAAGARPIAPLTLRDFIGIDRPPKSAPRATALALTVVRRHNKLNNQ